jgi:hypothetical protein
MYFVMYMKCLAIQSSPNLDGLTSSLAQAVLNGVTAEGGETDLIHLNELDIQTCIACNRKTILKIYEKKLQTRIRLFSLLQFIGMTSANQPRRSGIVSVDVNVLVVLRRFRGRKSLV